MLSETSQLPEDKRCMTPPMRGRRVDSSRGQVPGPGRGEGELFKRDGFHSAR